MTTDQKPDLQVIDGGKPRTPEIHYTFGSSGIVVQGSGKVISPGFITFTVGGEVVGSLDATFDFSDLDPALHAMGANMIIQRRMNLALGGIAHQLWPDRYMSYDEYNAKRATEIVKQSPTWLGWIRSQLVRLGF